MTFPNSSLAVILSGYRIASHMNRSIRWIQLVVRNVGTATFSHSTRHLISSVIMSKRYIKGMRHALMKYNRIELCSKVISLEYAWQFELWRISQTEFRCYCEISPSVTWIVSEKPTTEEGKCEMKGLKIFLSTLNTFISIFEYFCTWHPLAVFAVKIKTSFLLLKNHGALNTN